MIVAICGHPQLARHLAELALRTSIAGLNPDNERWVAWIAGRQLKTAELAAPTCGGVGSLRPPLRAAILSHWDTVLETSTKKALAAGQNAVTHGDKVLVQLARWRSGDEQLSEKVLRRSFGRWFAYAYHKNTSYDLIDKMPFVYLFGREVEPGPPVELVARIGTHISHLKKPPSRSFPIPEGPRERLEELIAWTQDARAQGVALWTHRSPEGVQWLLGGEQPSLSSDSLLGDS